jgi:hypothetical protein
VGGRLQRLHDRQDVADRVEAGRLLVADLDPELLLELDQQLE